MNKHARNISRALAPLAVIMAALIAAAPAAAQETGWTKYNFGLQASALMPTGDKLKEIGGTGFGLAGYAEKIWSNSWALRGRLEYTYFGEKDYTAASKTQASLTGLFRLCCNRRA